MLSPFHVTNSQDDCPHCKLPTVCKNCGRRRKLPPEGHDTTSLCIYSTASQCDARDHAGQAEESDVTLIDVVSPENLRKILHELEVTRTSLEKCRLEAETLREENDRIFDRCRQLKEELVTKERILVEKDRVLESAKLEFGIKLDLQKTILLNSHRVSVDKICHRFSRALDREKKQQLARRWRTLTRMHRKARNRSRACCVIETWILRNVRSAWRTLLMFQPKRKRFAICQLSTASIDHVECEDCSSKTLTSCSLVSCGSAQIGRAHNPQDASTCTYLSFSLEQVVYHIFDFFSPPGSDMGTLTSEEWPSDDAQSLVRRQLLLIRYMNRRIRFLERKGRRNFLIRTFFL